MNIRGLYKTSLIDFPGRISSVIFIGGCNLKCGYCHNPELALNSKNLTRYSDEEVLDFLKKRKGLIDGVTVSGGEPTLAKSLIPFLKKIKDIPLEIKIDSNGLRPEVIAGLVKNSLADYVAIDIKTSPDKYNSLTGFKIKFSKISETVEILKNSPIDYEIRTTCIPGYVSMEDFTEIGRSLGQIKRYYLQQFISDVPLLDKKMESLQPFSVKKLEEFLEYVKTFSDHCAIRGI